MTSLGTVSTLLIPAGGLGTRMLPATKVLPKELLPLVDRPIVQYGVEEAVRSGIRQVVLITNPENTLTTSHFNVNQTLESALTQNKKSELLETVRNLTTMANVTSLPQVEPRGLGHAVLCGKPAVGDHPFAVLLPDDVIDAEPAALQQMLDVFSETAGPVLLVERVPRTAVSRYGIIAADPVRNGVLRVTDLVEKPDPKDAPSEFAIIGRYILTPDIFESLEQTPVGTGGEIQLTDALQNLLAGRPIHACVLQGTRLDAGTKIGYVNAVLHFALKHPELGPELKETLKQLFR
jgi:UTP--glucose-1-phosphate uridylyltransferase